MLGPLIAPSLLIGPPSRDSPDPAAPQLHLREYLRECLHRLIHLLVRHDIRRQEAQHGAVNAIERQPFGYSLPAVALVR